MLNIACIAAPVFKSVVPWREVLHVVYDPRHHPPQNIIFFPNGNLVSLEQEPASAAPFDPVATPVLHLSRDYFRLS